MEWYEILIIVFACAFVLGVLVWQIVRRKQGKGGCDCGCEGCPSCRDRSSCACGCKTKETKDDHTSSSP